ncbi:unnamed protein product [Linum tenue]|uniref:Receptor-like serine/threonine-protein kinase n=1 Tax=Linum tenue TaxID=586396 RepID=A0AAV0GQE2_9ROSI|nr:unnamed protein product [Linum tenue]
MLFVMIHSTAAAILAVIVTFSQLHPLFAAATNTLNQGDALNSSDHLVSNNGRFLLGFMNRSYLGIWFNSSLYDPSTRSHPVWVASRDRPLFQNQGALTIDASGKLEILQDAGDPVEIYSGNGNPTRGNVSAVLEDSGNLVVKAKGSSSEEVLWQSFDHPTDTLLPGMKLGFSNKTREEKRWKLTSWLDEENPAPGAFTVEWDYKARQLLVKMRESVFWRSGVLDANSGKFPATWSLAEVNKNFNFTTVSGLREESFSYELYEEGLAPGRSHESQWVMGYQGTILDARARIMILNFQNCDGNKNEDNGCERWESGPTCSRRPGDRMVQRVALAFGFPDIRNRTLNLSFADCKELCWRNCSCTGVQVRDGDARNFTGCTFYTSLFSFQDIQGNEAQVYAILPAPPPPKRFKRVHNMDNYSKQDVDTDRRWCHWWSTHNGRRLLVVLEMEKTEVTWLLTNGIRIPEKFLKELMTIDRPSDASPHEDNGNSKDDNSLQVYTALSITNATNSFSLNNKLGEGGFGPVYRGRLKEGQEVAVKRLSRTSGQGLVEFKNELILIAKLQHSNLVRLLGFCVQGEERMLVYEYMPNRSLDSFIFDETRRKWLGWKARFNILEGIAQGLLYLHKYSRVRIIHRDLKVSNILLDKDMNPKISDFGMARIFEPGDAAQDSTRRIVGTYGYMSPEYAAEGTFSVKSDVYSFGVIVLEIVTGKKNHRAYHSDRPLNLAGYAWELWNDDNGGAVELLDPAVKGLSAGEEGDGCREEALRCINIGLLCVQNDPRDRPVMGDVLSMLTNGSQQLPMPLQPAFYLGRYGGGTSTSSENYTGEEEHQSKRLYSVNELSLSTMRPR